MADDDQTDDGAPEAAGAATAPKSRGKLRSRLMIALAVVLLAGGGTGAYMYFSKYRNAANHATEPKAPPPPVFVEIPEILVNLAGAAGERVHYLKVKAVLEVKGEPQAGQVKPVLPRVVDLFQTYLRELRPSDLHGSMGLFRLKEELTRRANAAVSPGQINAVLFKEVVIQ